jgi:hypothetical protein
MSFPPPLELCEAIIDQLHSDKPSLRACSLTCNAWVPRSRYHLLHYIGLYPFNVQNFLDILSSTASPGSYVRTLKINEGRGRYRTEPRWLSDALPLLAKHMLEITKLDIDLMEWHLLDEAARAGITSGFQSVEILVLTNVKFKMFTQLANLVASFPSLKSLSCDGLSGVEDGAPIAVPLTYPPCGLHALHLGPFPKSAFVDWFLSQDTIPEIRTLSLAHSLSQAQNVGRLLQGLGPRLEHLEIGLTSHFEKGQAAGWYGFMLSPKYRTLTLISFSGLEGPYRPCGQYPPPLHPPE